MLHNKSLLSKWLWRYNQEEHALLKEVIQHKLSQEGEWCSDEVTTTYGVGVWRTIRSFWPTLEVNTKVKVGRGDKVLFWKEDWIGQGSLQSLFPGLYSIKYASG